MQTLKEFKGGSLVVHITEMPDLRDDVEGIISASDFIEVTDGAQLLFI